MLTPEARQPEPVSSSLDRVCRAVRASVLCGQQPFAPACVEEDVDSPAAAGRWATARSWPRRHRLAEVATNSGSPPRTRPSRMRGGGAVGALGQFREDLPRTGFFRRRPRRTRGVHGTCATWVPMSSAYSSCALIARAPTAPPRQALARPHSDAVRCAPPPQRTGTGRTRSPAYDRDVARRTPSARASRTCSGVRGGSRRRRWRRRPSQAPVSEERLEDLAIRRRRHPGGQQPARFGAHQDGAVPRPGRSTGWAVPVAYQQKAPPHRVRHDHRVRMRRPSSADTPSSRYRVSRLPVSDHPVGHRREAVDRVHHRKSRSRHDADAWSCTRRCPRLCSAGPRPARTGRIGTASSRRRFQACAYPQAGGSAPPLRSSYDNRS